MRWVLFSLIRRCVIILFQEDWQTYPSSIVHVSTKNESFLRYANILKAVGVKNYLWPLALIHPELEYVDPFSLNLTTDEKVLISLECKINPWYYLREIVRIPGSTTEVPIRFNANRGNMSMFWTYFNHITFCLVMPRQTGKTFGINTLDSYLLNIRNKGGRTILLTKDEKLRSTTMTEIKKISEELPFYLKQLHKTDISNSEEINVSRLDNNYKALIARNDPSAADKTGRGNKVNDVRVDEFAYLYHVNIAVPVLLAATTAARKLAEMVDNTYGNIFATTAGKKDDAVGEYAYHYFHNSSRWTEFLLDCQNKEELDNVVKSSSKDSKYLRVFGDFNHRQLGYTDEWLRAVAAETNSSGEIFSRDYLGIWSSGSQNSPFSIEDVKRMRESQSEVLYGEISRFNQIMFRWYLKEDQINKVMLNDHTCIAVDTSDAMGRDEFAVNIRHLRTGEILGVASINEINLITVSNFLVDLLKRFPKATMIIERRNQAAAIIDYMHQQMIANGLDPFRRLYNTCVQDYLEFPERYKEIQNPRNSSNENFLAQFKKYFGFTTSGTGTTARSELYGTTLRQAVKYTGDYIKDKPTIDQLLALVIKDGRVDHPKGGHDDLCVGWLLSYWFMTNGKNLQYYGIPNNYVLSTNQIVNSVSNKEERYQTELNRRAKEHIDKLVEIIKQEKDPNVVERLIFEIENVKNILGPQNEISLSVDEMINQIKKNKASRYYVKRSMF